MIRLPYTNRTAAAQELVICLRHYAGRSNVLVLGMPREGGGLLPMKWQRLPPSM
jgi:predicted phosphoribosyltransferase